jgi:tetratricopeptide (TPR) repeat protein
MFKKPLQILLIILVSLLFACKTTKTGIETTTPTESANMSRGVQQGGDNSEVFIEANKQKLLGNIEEAGRLFNKCLEINPSDDASMYELAKIKIGQNNPDEALELLEKAVSVDPSNDYYQVLYASLLLSLDKYSEASKVFRKLTETNPFNLDYYNQLAISYLYDGKTDDAIKVYNDLESKIGVTEEISMKKYSIYIQAKKIDKAQIEIENLIKQFPDESKYYSILAELYLDNGMKEKALETYNKILEIDPGNPYIHISLADYYKKNGDTVKSFEELKAGFSNPNLDIDTKIQILLNYYTITEIYSDLKEQAFELSKILITVHATDPKSWSMYGDFLYQDKQYEAARDVFRKVISIDSSKYLVWEQLLFAESQLEDQDAVLSESTIAIELFPEHPLPYLFAGGAHYQKKNWDKCIETLNTGLGYVFNNQAMEVQFRAYLGDAYNQLGDDIKSDESYEKVLKLDPDNDYVLNNYAYYLSLRNTDLEKAEKMAKKATELKPNSSANQDTYGWVLYKLGKYEDAKVWIGKAIENEAESSAVILEHYGDVLWQLGDRENAILYWLKAEEKGKGSEFLERKVEEKQLIE